MKAVISDILTVVKCPVTGADLKYKDNHLESENGAIYTINDGIVDLVAKSDSDSQLKTEISYDSLSQNKYDRIVGNGLFLRLVWGFDKKKVSVFPEFAGVIPDGIVLDVPCGTGLYNIEAYERKSTSIFIALDYSLGMLKMARKKCLEAGVENVVFVRGDVSNLPFKDKSINGCLSLNGFHVFPNPSQGAMEIGRTLMTDAPMIMTVACSEERVFSDFMINNVMIPRGFFNNKLPRSTYQKMLINANFDNFEVQMFGAIMLAKCIQK